MNHPMHVDPDILRYREEREKRIVARRPLLDAAKALFEEQLRQAKTGGRKGKNGRARGRGIVVPLSERARVLRAIDASSEAMREKKWWWRT